MTKDAISLFTLVLAVSTIWLAWSTRNLWRETRDGGETSKRLADAAESQSNLLARQSDIMNRQQGLARAQFFATHRPLVKVRWVRKTEGDFPVISFGIVNAGTSKGIVKDSSINAAYMHPDDTPDVHDTTVYPRNDVIPRGRELEPGATDRFEVTSVNSHSDSNRALRLFGWIVYEDEYQRLDFDGDIIANRRTTYIMREFNPASGYFEPVPDPDYNAED